MNEHMFAFGNLLVQYREKLGITREKIAESLGQLTETIIEWEECVSFPASTRLAKVASVYQGNLEELKEALLISSSEVKKTHRKCVEAQKPTKQKTISKDAWGFIPSTSSGHRVRTRAPI